MVNDAVVVAQQLVDKIRMQYPEFVGRTATEQEILDLEHALKIKLPAWYRNLFLNVPIIDAEFGFQEFPVEEKFDGVSQISIGDLGAVLEESTVYTPGKEVLNKGLLFIASCSHGSGDPIFINNSGSVFRVYHDDLSLVQVADSFVCLLKNAIIK